MCYIYPSASANLQREHVSVKKAELDIKQSESPDKQASRHIQTSALANNRSCEMGSFSGTILMIGLYGLLVPPTFFFDQLKSRSSVTCQQ